MNNRIKEAARPVESNISRVETTMVELDSMLVDLDKEKIEDLPKNLSIKLGNIECKLKQIDKSIHFQESRKPLIMANIDNVVTEQFNRYRNAVVQALREMCSNILTNSRDIERLNSIIARLPNVKKGEIVMNRMLSNIDIIDSRLTISRRKSEVLTQLLGGKTNRKISQELDISEKTVKNHLWKIYRKLGVKNRTQLFHRLISS